jgi:2-polyprenyl-6-methoxyphenol hydroxylase-like FAD-dependent oxidoreductase
MSNLPVLIVGAGPTGLVMACELARHAIPFRIIDKKSEPTIGSNAIWIQPRTMELFDQMGLIDHFIQIGYPCNAINLYADGNHLSRLSSEKIDSVYPYFLMLAQAETENILEAHLKKSGNQIERSSELIDIKYTDNNAITTIKHSDGKTEMINSDWVVACDGANSIIREKSGLNFKGEDITEQFMVADAVIDFSYMPKDEIHYFFDQGTLFAAFPLGSGRYRVAANLHLGYPRKIFTEREVIEIVQERGHGKYYVKNVEWISPFWIHGKLVEHMRQGLIFFAGDAAHIHSPAGGQGMNTGIQDAFNLAWKMALVIQGKAKTSLLDTYHDERYPIVKKVVSQNNHFTKMALFDNDFLQKIKEFSEKISGNEMHLSKEITTQIAQLDIRYENSHIIDSNEKMNTASPQQGERFPDVAIQKGTLYQHFRNTQHNIILFAGSSSDEKSFSEIMKIQKSLSEKYSNLVTLHIISKTDLPDVGKVILDSDNEIHEYYKINHQAIYIVRPDTYIAYCSENIDLESMERFFAKTLMLN